jgi:hypothetical protein
VNYTELSDAVQEYLQTNEPTFVASMPLFVRQAEQRLYRLIQIPEFRRRDTATLTAGSPQLARPADMLSVLSLATIDTTGAYEYLMPKDPEFLREAYPDPTALARPRFYSQLDGAVPPAAPVLLLAPTPDQNYAVELLYTYDPPSISVTNTSWLGDNAETALLYGTLIEAYVFQKGDQDLMQVYKTRYDEALALLGVIDAKQRRDNYRDGDRGLK